MERAHRTALLSAGLLAVGVAVAVLAFRAADDGPRPTHEAADRPDPEFLRAISEPRDRVQAARRAGANRDRRAVSVLATMARQARDAEFRKACLQALGEIGDPEALIPLAGIIESGPEDISLAGVQAAVKIPGEAAVRLLFTLVSTSLPVEVQRAALRGLAERGEPEALEALRKALVAPETDIRVRAVDALAGKPGEVASAILRAALKDFDPRVRLAITKALVGRTDRQAAAGLLLAAKEQQLGVREAALAGLRKMGETNPEAFARRLVQAQRIEDLETALAAAKSLPLRESVALFVAALDRAEQLGADARAQEDFRRGVAGTLSQMGPEVLEPLNTAAIQGDCGLLAKKAAGDAIVRLRGKGGELVRQRLLGWKLFPNPEELRVWVRALGELGDPAAAPVLQHAEKQVPFDEGLKEYLALARKRIEAVSGKALPARQQEDAAAAPPELPTPSWLARPEAKASSLAPGAWPPDATVTLKFSGALEAKGEGVRGSLVLELVRRGGRWEKWVRGTALGLNQAEHEGLLAEAPAGTEPGFFLRLALHDDGWTRGGYGEFQVRLSAGPPELRGSFQGRLDRRPVQGSVTGTVSAWSPPCGALTAAEPGEHPRLFFRKSDLALLRAKTRTELGRKLVSAMLDRLADGRGPRAAPAPDRAVGHGLLSVLFEDPAHARRAAEIVSREMAAWEHEDDFALAAKVRAVAVVYDLTHPHLTDRERRETEAYLLRAGDILTPGVGMTGVFGDGPGRPGTAAGCGAVGLAALALWREKGSFDLARPREPERVAAAEALRPPPSLEAAPLNELKPGELLRNWLVLGPLDRLADRDPLAALGGPSAAHPGPSAAVETHAGKRSFTLLDPGCVRRFSQTAVPGERICLPEAGPARWLLYALLRTGSEQGGRLQLAHREERLEVKAWLNGQRISDGQLLVLQPGVHALLVETPTPVLRPVFFPAEVQTASGSWERFLLLDERWHEAQAEHGKTGERTQPSLALAAVRGHVRHWFEAAAREPHALGAGEAKSPLDWLLPLATACRLVTCEPLPREEDLAQQVRALALKEVTAAGDQPAAAIRFGMPFFAAASEDFPPTAMRSLASLPREKLESLSCLELLFALVYLR